jgi:hypothetical protein
MATIRQTLKRAATALQRVEAFVAEGGDLKSEAATTVGLDFLSAKQFGYDVAKPVKRTAILKVEYSTKS